MNRILVTLLVMLLPLSLPAATLSGLVKQSGTLAPLSGMTVELYSPAGVLAARTTTSSTGAYQFSVPGGTYHLLAYDPAGAYATTFHPDAESWDTSGSINLESTQSARIDLLLRRAGWIVGVVTSSDGTPLTGMTVAVYNESGTLRGSTSTDASGAYRLVVPAGNYKVAAWDDEMNYLPRFSDGTLTFDEASPMRVETSLEITRNVTLPAASVLEGKVIDGATGGPLAGMVAEAWTADGRFVRWALTDHAGAFRLPLESGEYKLVFSDPGGVFAGSYYGNTSSFAAAVPIWLAPGETRTGVTGEMLRGGRVTGRVLDARTLAPLVNISVGAWNSDGSLRTLVRTDGIGQYVLVLPPGEFRIGAFDETLEYVTRFIDDSSSFAAATPVAVVEGSHQPQRDLLLAKGGRFTGTIRSAAGSPIPGMTVAAFTASGERVAETTSAADGSYVLLVPPGSYTVSAWSERQPQVVASREAAVAESQTLSGQDLVLELRTRRRGVSRSGPAGSAGAVPASMR